MTIFKSAFVISFFTIASRIAGFIRDMLVAKIVGSGFYADVFFAAFKLTNLLRKLLAEGSFFAAFIPSFTGIKEKYGMREAQNFATKMFSITFYVLLLITILSNLFMPQLTKAMTPGFVGEKLAATISLSYIIFWYLMCVSLVSILSGILNAIHKFAYYAIVPMFFNIVLIIFLIFFQGYFENIGYCLAWGVVCGGIVQLIFIYCACVYEKFTVTLKMPSRMLFNAHTKTAYKRMLPAILAGGLTQINTIIDMILGSYIESGVSYLYYVDRIFYLPTSVIGTAISIVILPFISKQIAQNHIQGAHKVVNEAIELSSIFVIPAAFLLFFLAEVVTSVLFERGAFNLTDVHFVSNMLQILAIGLPFCVFNKVTSSIFFSYSDTKTPMYITLGSVLINIVLSIGLMPLFGIYAITIGTACSYCASCIISVGILIMQKRLVVTFAMLLFILKIVVSTLVCALIVWLATCHPQLGYNAVIRNTNLAIKLFYLLGIGCVFSVMYLATSLIMRANILRMIFARV